MRQQYHARQVGADRHIWDVHRLVRLSREFPVFELPLTELSELDENWWYAGADSLPTPRSLAAHIRLMQVAELCHPILLCAEGRLMDGMHRALRALVEGSTVVKAVRFPVTPSPDYVNVALEDLPYPEHRSL